MKSKRYISFASLFFCGALVLSGCSDDFLDKNPDERVTLDSPTKLEELLNASYPDGNYGWIGELSSDNIMDNNAPHLPSNPNAQQVVTHYNLGSYDRGDDEMFRFEQCVSATHQDSPYYLWYSAYTSIASCNYVLEALQKGVKDDNSGYNTKVIEAEARLLRAYNHFILVNVFSQAYKDDEASRKDVGVPYVTQPETNTHVHYERGSVTQTYDSIQHDLELGLADITDENYKTAPKYHFNVNAAHAFAARFYLFRRNYDKVIEHADAVLGIDSASVVSGLMDWAPCDSCSTGTDYAKVFQDYASPNNLFLIDTQSRVFRHGLGNRYGLISTAARDVMFHSSPMWRGYIANPTALVGGYLFWIGEDYGYCGAKAYERFQYTDRLAGIGYVHTIRREFTRMELLLERAEAKIMKADYKGAFQDLYYYSLGLENYSPATKATYVSQARLLPLSESMLDSYYSSSRNSNCFDNWDFTKNMSSSFVVPAAAVKYMNCLNDLRRFETVWDGLRFFDLKRWGIEYSHIYGPDSKEYKLTWDDERRAIEIPEEAIVAGLQPSQKSHATSGSASAKPVPFSAFAHSVTFDTASALSKKGSNDNTDSYSVIK